jgi:predicted RNA-binding protein YlqC (UPF0109 family)
MTAPNGGGDPSGDWDAGEVDVDTGNRLVGAVGLSVLDYVVRQLVDEPDAVVIDCVERGAQSVEYRVHVDPSDMGRVIGKRGHVAKAVRTLVRAAAAREGVEASVEIVE